MVAFGRGLAPCSMPRVTATRPASCRSTRAFLMPRKRARRLGLAESAQSEITGVADELAGRHLQFRPMGAADAEGASALEAACFEGAATRRGRRAVSIRAGRGCSPRRAAGGWRTTTASCSGLAGGMVVDDDVQILDVAVDPRIAARVLPASCCRT